MLKPTHSHLATFNILALLHNNKKNYKFLSVSFLFFLNTRKPFKKLKLREKSPTTTKSSIWFNDYDNINSQKSTEKFCEKQTDNSSCSGTSIENERNPSTTGEHQIRIAVNFDYEKCCVNKHLELHSSLSSNETVSTADKQQVEAYNELVVLQQLCDQHQKFTEKAIDVPKEFEENAYSNRHQNCLSLRQRENQYSLVSAIDLI